MRFLIGFLILMFLCVGLVYYSNAQGKMPKMKWDGPYYAACVAKRAKNSLTGWAKARSTPAGRNGSYMCSMGMDVMPVSGSNIDGDFSDGVSHAKPIHAGPLYADSSSWGSDKNNGTWAATVSDSAQ